MLFIINEKEVYEELMQNSPSLGTTRTSISNVIQRLAQEKRHKTTTIAYLKTYLHQVSHIKETSVTQ